VKDTVYLMLDWSVVRGYPAAILVPLRVTITSLPDRGLTLYNRQSYTDEYRWCLCRRWL